MKDDRFLILFDQPSWAKRKGSLPRLEWEKVVKKDLKEIGTSWEKSHCIEVPLHRLGRRRSVRSCVSHR